MSLRRLLTMLLSVGLLGLPMLLLGAGPASATDINYVSEVTVIDPGTRVYNGPLTIKGQVLVDDGAGDSGAMPGATVTLSRQWNGSDTWVELGTAVTDDTYGYYVFSQTAAKNATYKVTYAGETIPASNGDNYVVAGSEASQAVRVMRDLNDQGYKKDGKLFMKGNVNPGWGNKAIVLQRANCLSCTYKAVDKQKTSSTGAWKFRLYTRAGGSYFYRVRIAGTTDYVASISRPIETYRI